MKTLKTPPARDARGRFLPRAALVAAPATVLVAVGLDAVRPCTEAPAPALRRAVLPACLAPVAVVAPAPALVRAVLAPRYTHTLQADRAVMGRRRLVASVLTLGGMLAPVAVWAWHTGALARVLG